MRELSKTEIDRIEILNKNSISVTLIEPTAVGLRKHIMDATGQVRNYLKKNDYHDYESQGQGAVENRVFIESVIITDKALIKTKSSLYRPKAKQKGGDPRIWISKLPKYANPNDILALFCYDKKIWVINITQLPIEDLTNSILGNPIKNFINDVRAKNNQISDELLSKLKDISKLGFVKSLVNHDTGVGRTLEHLLGIQMNSSKTPDYKGIELKAFQKKSTRKGLFAKIPNWELSKFKSRIEILDEFGYADGTGLRLYNTIRGTGRNAQGLILSIKYDQNLLVENSDRQHVGDFLAWELDELKKTLANKHIETFWISSEKKTIDGDDYYWYKSVEHTKNPLLDQFELLIEMGAITIDYNIKRTPEGEVFDKGCNFKISSKFLNLLFPPSLEYDLTS